jgi:hypothetical protein
MSAVPTYRIRDWEKNFMHGDHKRRANGAMTWVRMPTKLDGKSYRRLMRMNPMHYLAWTLIVKVAAKCPEKGLLADEDGPLTAEDLSIKTDAPKSVFESAFVPLCSVGWLECVGQCPTVSDNIPSASDTVPLTVQYSTVHNNIAVPASDEVKNDVHKPSARKPTVNAKVWKFITSPKPDGLGLSEADARAASGVLKPTGCDWSVCTLGLLWFCLENPPPGGIRNISAYLTKCKNGKTMRLSAIDPYETRAAAKLRWIEREVQEETGDFNFNGHAEPETE